MGPTAAITERLADAPPEPRRGHRLYSSLAEARAGVRARPFQYCSMRIPVGILLALRENDLLDLAAVLEYAGYEFRIYEGDIANEMFRRCWFRPAVIA